MGNPKRFALIGAAGYVAPRHLQAILDTGHQLVAASDPSDSVGILDRYFFGARYFKEFERLDRYAEKARRSGQGIDYVSICSPNYLHDAHVRFALRAGAHAICEKPLVINPWNVAPLEELAREHERKIYPVLQLREHAAIRALREHVRASVASTHHVALEYITARGPWYHTSWKGSEAHSGGLACNIGVHFFDILLWIFGDLEESFVTERSPQTVAGLLRLERATVRWRLSVDRESLPAEARAKGESTYRNISVDGRKVEFSKGFADLHTIVYRKILADQSCHAADALPAISLVRTIRDSELSPDAQL